MADYLVFSKLPEHPFWSHIESKIDFSFADRLCSVLYTGRGQHPYAPSLKLKIHLIQAYYNLSDRLVEEKIIGDLFIKRFLQLPVDFFGFDHSTIGLDRSRMGTLMFQACHMYILAQMLHLGLWGDKDEQWIIDSFPSHAHAVTPGAYRLIQQGMIRIMQYLKRTFHDAYNVAIKELDLDQMMKSSPKDAQPQERLLAFSKLTAQAHALLGWFETDRAIQRICADERRTDSRKRLLELQQVLVRILRDYTQEAQKSNDDNGSDSHSPKPEDQAVSPSEENDVMYEKVPFSKRPSDRIVSAHHPDVRVGRKNVSTKIKGFKVQVMSTTSGVITNTRVVPATEHDRDAMADMAKEVQHFFKRTPNAIIGDTAYGHGKQRVELKMLGMEVIAPVITTQNPTKLWDNSEFTYHPEKDVFTCPQQKETIRKNHSAGLAGTQYFFGKRQCEGCLLLEQCTTNKNGRSVFLSDYHTLYDKAKVFNETDAGKEAFLHRYAIERKNQELKNDCGLGSPWATRQTTVDMKSKAAAMVVNLKLVIRKLIAPKPGFLRSAPQTVNGV